MNTEPTYCRICDSRCGLIAEINGEGLSNLRPDESDPVSLGYICETATQSLSALQAPDRITEPMKRVNGTLTPVSWETAIQEIGTALRSIRAATGPNGISLYLGEEVQRSTRTLMRSLAFGVGAGTPHIFSEQCLGPGPQLWVTEQMIGHAAPLLSDLGRAHYVLLLSGEQRDLGWGPLAPGMAHERWLQHSRRTKKTKVIVADPRRTPLAETMDQHLPIRPGTEPYLLIGMLVAVVRSGWYDAQFVRDYTENFDRIKEVLAPWDVEKCAKICGIDAPTLSGIALKFSRAAMAVVHPAKHSFSNEAGAMGAWAWLALHTITANTLRPGGLYESKGAFDLFPVLAQVPTSGAPKTQTQRHPLLWMQAPATAMTHEINAGAVKAMITVNGNPLGVLPGTSAVRASLRELELLVCIGRTEDDTAAEAHWVLPAAHSWEQESLCLHDNSLLPIHGSIWTPALVPPRNESRPEHEILRDLYAVFRPGLRSSTWGKHLGFLAQYIARADLPEWEHRVVSWSSNVDPESAPDGSRRIHLGDTDRSTWRPSTDNGLINLFPDALIETVRSTVIPTIAPMTLRTAQPADRAPDSPHRSQIRPETIVRLHPDSGHKDGERVSITTANGSCIATVEHDELVRPDVADIPFIQGTQALELLDPNQVDKMTGSPVLDGIGCTIQSA
jgi:anaerobic selenocysteine-containing dehydrogenase